MSSAVFIFICILVFVYFSNIKAQMRVSLDGNKTALCLEASDCPTAKYRFDGKCPCSAPAICCIESGMARTKCKEYEQYVDQNEIGAALMVQKTTTKVSTCQKTVPLIVGGEKVLLREFPHMVSIGVGPPGNISWVCGGTLISEQHVLTAAHCTTTRDMGPAKWAKIGTLNVSDLTDENAQDFTITETIRHPGYIPPSRYNDVAIFKLDRVVSMTGHARPACLNTEPDVTYPYAMATGWGKLSYASKVGSEYLMKVHLELIDLAKCNETYQIDVGGKILTSGIVGKQLCAGVEDDGKPASAFNSQYNDTCQGDSGGPLQVDLAGFDCMTSVIGVTSFGKLCGFRVPGVYTRVSYYVPWIESILWP